MATYEYLCEECGRRSKSDWETPFGAKIGAQDHAKKCMRKNKLKSIKFKILEFTNKKKFTEVRIEEFVRA